MRYCPYFCEENVWHLCQDASVGVPVAERSAVFISNRARAVAMRHQRAGALVMWDYHVVMIARGAVWDLDTTLGMPVPLARYVDECFFDAGELAPRFRVVDAPTFIETFASDRTHMEGTGRPYPAWGPIGAGMNLMRFVDVDDPFVGERLDRATFVASCASTSSRGG